MKAAKIFINESLDARKVLDSGKQSYELRHNSHKFYQIGRKNDSGETFRGLVRKLKVFATALSTNEIRTEMSGMSKDLVI